MRLFPLLFPALLLAGTPAAAASLRVAPVGLDIAAPGASATIRVWNEAPDPVNVQIRIFRWEQVDGEERLVPTRDVAVSPPITTLKGGGENVVRIVRMLKTPVTAEESYRLIVDELPDPARAGAGRIALVVRHSIPVFFGGPARDACALHWTVRPGEGGYEVTLDNRGARHRKISNLRLRGDGAALGEREGLVGYALAGAQARWFIAAPAGKAVSTGTIRVTADSDSGPVDATASLSGG